MGDPLLGALVLIASPLVAIIALYFYNSTFAKCRIVAHPGRTVNDSFSFTEETSLGKADIHNAPKETTETKYARSVTGRASRISVERTVAPSTRNIKSWNNQLVENGLVKSEWTSYTAETTYIVTLAVSVNDKVAPGRYFSFGRGGHAVINVQKRS